MSENQQPKSRTKRILSGVGATIGVVVAVGVGVTFYQAREIAKEGTPPPATIAQSVTSQTAAPTVLPGSVTYSHESYNGNVCPIPFVLEVPPEWETLDSADCEWVGFQGNTDGAIEVMTVDASTYSQDSETALDEVELDLGTSHKQRIEGMGLVDVDVQQVKRVEHNERAVFRRVSFMTPPQGAATCTAIRVELVALDRRWNQGREYRNLVIAAVQGCEDNFEHDSPGMAAVQTFRQTK